MYSELECGICYLTYNAGRRCPRELHCKHSFCGSCLLALSRPPAPHEGAARIVCPLCRHTTSISGELAELKVAEGVLEMLKEEGCPEEEEEEEDSNEATLDATEARESDSSAGSRRGKFRRSWKKVRRVIFGKSSQQLGAEVCLTGVDMKNIAMMSCYMF